MLHFVDGLSSTGFNGKLTEIYALSHHAKHRTTLGHFLQHSPWEESFLLQQSQRHVLKQMGKKEPRFCILDDIIAQKTKPSSRAMSPMEEGGFHFSIQIEKVLGGHQVVQFMMANEQTGYPYDFRLFEKEQGQSKIDLSLELIQEVLLANQPTYLLCDSWYTSKKVMEAALQQGMHTIGALKTNRILYPQGIRHVCATEDTDLVTIGQETYRVYRYEGALNEWSNGIVLLCWSVEEDQVDPKGMRCFLSTDVELTSEQILT